MQQIHKNIWITSVHTCQFVLKFDPFKSNFHELKSAPYNPFDKLSTVKDFKKLKTSLLMLKWYIQHM